MAEQKIRRSELMEKLHISSIVFDKLLKQGLPYGYRTELSMSRKFFTFSDVKNWLKEKGCDLDDPYYGTLMCKNEIAEEFSCSISTIDYYTREKGMPFKRFASGKKAFDLDDCNKWLEHYEFFEKSVQTKH